MIFGKPQAWLYSIEWQKRGLPHCHLLLWLSAEHRITSDKIDDVICAEIPDPSLDPDLHQIVMSNMVHGPCGCINPNSPCMHQGECFYIRLLLHHVRGPLPFSYLKTMEGDLCSSFREAYFRLKDFQVRSS